MPRFNDQPWHDADKLEPNFMTPHIIERGRSGDWAWELSEGEGMEREPIFGCTFLLWDGERWQDPPESALKFSEPEARAYIEGVIVKEGE